MLIISNDVILMLLYTHIFTILIYIERESSTAPTSQDCIIFYSFCMTNINKFLI